ncbi:hypothetical protein [Pseudooceanicola sp. MF1-13]|uniref:hypothetical protein n=1 Tax=Pseudooceanicola sp. MF1-13 TaxID=3379095 RepID=UPI003892BBB1
MKRRWVIAGLGIAAIAIIGSWQVRQHRAASLYSVDRAVLDVTSFTYEALSMAVRDGLWDLMRFSDQSLYDQVLAVCLSVGGTDYKGDRYCPSITLLKGGDVGVFILSDAAGNLYLTEELVQATGGDRAMLAAILAHELGHEARLREVPEYQYYSHAQRRVVAQVSGPARRRLLWEDADAGADQIRAAPMGLVDYAFSAEEEGEARAFAQSRLDAAGLSPDGFARFLAVLRAQPDLPGAQRFLRVHGGSE